MLMNGSVLTRLIPHFPHTRTERRVPSKRLLITSKRKQDTATYKQERGDGFTGTLATPT